MRWRGDRNAPWCRWCHGTPPPPRKPPLPPRPATASAHLAVCRRRPGLGTSGGVARPSSSVPSSSASDRAARPPQEAVTGGASGATTPEGADQRKAVGAPRGGRDPFERSLVRRLQRQAPRAFEELVRTYQHRVFGLVYRMLGDRHEAEDVAQEVFLSVFRAIGRYRGDGRFQTWLFRIAANACRTRLRQLASRAAHRAEPLDSVEDVAGASANPPVAAQVAGPEAAAAGRRLEEAIQRELSALDEDQRLLIVLRDIEGLSYQEILAVTGLPEGTLKSRLHRARLALKERLRPYLS
ncbi:MAG: sigma-70 family RNA polymerase sigma factor [Deltaproteobacteria bacterium]|nr:MAG: sigma-70 family RNA polymerase sigma factor [Deltaproteobacteria bacterium]